MDGNAQSFKVWSDTTKQRYCSFISVTFLSWKHCDIYFRSSRTATGACYSLLESVKTMYCILLTFFLRRWPQLKARRWLVGIKKWMIHFRMLSHLCTTHWWIRSDGSEEIMFFFRKRPNHHSESPTNSPMSHTKMTQHMKMSHPFVDLDQSETSF